MAGASMGPTSKQKRLILTGSPASDGLASGRVKQIIEASDDDEIPEGHVLVAAMTTPDMLLYMLNANAIVTDIGGITSHAAIVARELGIPCVVATEIATTVLQDNDEIEVDGTTGSVYRLD